MKTLIILLSSAFIFAACSPKYYVPNTQNVPLISEKGETNVNVTGNGNQVEFQGAYGVSNAFAVQLNSGWYIPADLDNGNGGSGRFVEFGGGYFNTIRENWVLETYGIVGFGKFENHLPSTTMDSPQTNGDISANITRFGIQPNFGYKSKYFSAAISSRIVNLTYNNIDGDLIFENEDQVEYLKNNSSNFLIEPAITIKGGTEKIKLQLQYLYSANLTKSDFKQDNSLVSVGLNFKF